MRFFHLADLHIGKRIREVSLYQDQKYILNQIIAYTDQYRPDAILICGDIFDKADPSAEAIALFDEFLTGLSQYKQPIMIISGNHDSPQRINYGSKIMAKEHIYLAGTFDGQLAQVTLTDEYGAVCFHLLPFIKPAQIKRYYPDTEINDYEDAIRAILNSANLDSQQRNVLLCHQFITNNGICPDRSESEQIHIGTLGNIDASVFTGYDYVALGHIHRPQSIGGQHIRYAGSPLKYSFSEALHNKSLAYIALKEKGTLNMEFLPLTPLHDLRKIKGPIEKLLDPATFADTNREDYLHITLTDEEDLVDPLTSLRRVYPNIITLDFANSRYGDTAEDMDELPISQKSPWELFADFYKFQQNIDLNADKQQIVKDIFQKLEDTAQ